MPVIGLLAHYLELYDRLVPAARSRIDAFGALIAGELRARGAQVIESGICRVRGEFQAAVEHFERSDADIIVSLHLAYSPSLESADALAASKLPLVVLDTTPASAYGPGQEPEELLYNHGIHGVQDLCNVLIRRGRRFEIEAGHWQKSDVLDRVVAWANAAATIRRLTTARVGRIGEPFEGMGDFAVPPDTLKATLGITTVECPFERLASFLPAETDPEVAAEMETDLEAYDAPEMDAGLHRSTTRACLAVRRWIEADGLSAFTMNFERFHADCGMPTVPFLEASKAMARGIGYAGEGDVMTAAFVGALASAWPDTTFTEMFCPDWDGGAIYVSHMGEMNLRLTASRPRLYAKPLPWVAVGTPVLAVGRLRGGQATFADLAPAPGDTCRLLTAHVDMLDVAGEDRHADCVRGWFRPPMPVADFLEAYSRDGGTHHAALVYGDVADDLSRVARLMGWPHTILG
jgi:L-arabinose isomerase